MAVGRLVLSFAIVYERLKGARAPLAPELRDCVVRATMVVVP